jgi:small-conductance mechanosensitive channel
MFATLQRYIVFAWKFIFDHKVSPLKNIPDVAIRHYVLQILGAMWAISFTIAVGSYTYLAANLVGHVVLIAAFAITVATLTTAATRPQVFARASGRRKDGEHE